MASKDDVTRFWKLPFGISVTVFTHYVAGFEPYPHMPQRTRLLQVRMSPCFGKSTRCFHIRLRRIEKFE
ncbi:hypothetical protein RCZAHN_104 [Rhodobacter phage RcZahn]|nr:hypothetical protein RCZAHN_104 [Rhodobacter phage RcZahn]